MARRHYSSIAQRTTLSTSIDDTQTSITVAALTGYPASTPWVGVIEPDKDNEELVLVTSVTGTTLTVTRGYDGTTAVAHAAGKVFGHGWGSQEFDEVNSFLNEAGTKTGALTVSQNSSLEAAVFNMPVIASQFADIPHASANGTSNHVLQIFDGGTGGVFYRDGTSYYDGSIDVIPADSQTWAQWRTANPTVTTLHFPIRYFLNVGGTAYELTAITFDGVAPTLTVWDDGVSWPAATINKWNVYTFDCFYSATFGWSVFAKHEVWG